MKPNAEPTNVLCNGLFVTMALLCLISLGEVRRAHKQTKAALATADDAQRAARKWEQIARSPSGSVAYAQLTNNGLWEVVDPATERWFRAAITNDNPKPEAVGVRTSSLGKLRTVDVFMGGRLVITLSNVTAVLTNHENQTPPCTLVRYLNAEGKEQEFHAWLSEVRDK